MAVRTYEELVTNWWTKDTDMIDPEIIKRLDNNARRRIYTRIEKGEHIGTEFDEDNGVKYECHWRIMRKKKYSYERI